MIFLFLRDITKSNFLVLLYPASWIYLKTKTLKVRNEQKWEEVLTADVVRDERRE